MANNECLEILKQGIYETHITTRTDNKDIDYKNYFESEKFRTDLKSGSFGLGVGATIYGVPFNLNADSSDEEITEFQEKIKNTVDFKMSDNFFLQTAEIIPNKDIIDAYKACLEHKGFGFHISYEATESTITFRVYYSNLDINQKPKVENIVITPSSKLVFSSVNIGEEIKNNSESKYVFELAKDTKEVVFILDTDLTAVSQKAEIRKNGYEVGNIPIGTIISSYLSWEQFQKTTEHNKESGGFWKSASSHWSPCDGREIPNSKFEDITSQHKVLDLRGLFLRGLNTFDISETSVVDALHSDPDASRKVGSFQNCEIQSHTHPFNAAVYSNPIRGSGGGAPDGPSGSTTGATGSVETRPKNVSIFYYIRIN